MKILQEVRSWLIQEKIGLISKADLIYLVDGKISELNDPPDYLTSISLGESLEHVTRLDLTKYRVTKNDCVVIASKMLSLFKSGETSLDDLCVLTLKTCQLLGTQERPYIDFDWVNDEVHLVNEGIKEKDSSVIEIVKVLEGVVNL